MKRYLALLVAVILLSVSCGTFEPGAWIRLGDPIYGGLLDLTLDSSQRPVLAVDVNYRSDPPYGINLRRGTANGWVSPWPVLELVAGIVRVIMPNDENAIVVAERGSDRALVAYRWSGTSWMPMGGIIENPGFFDVGKSAQGVPFIVHNECIEGNCGLVVKRWNNVEWQLVGTRIEGPAYSPSLTIDTNGNPTVAYSSLSSFFSIPSETKISVVTWNGTAWTQYGNTFVAESGTYIHSPIVKLNSQNNPVLVWVEVNTEQDSAILNASKWDGSQWVDFPSPEFKNGVRGLVSHNPPSLALRPDGQPEIFWLNNYSFNNNTDFLASKYWDGTTWVKRGVLFEQDCCNYGVFNGKIVVPNNSPQSPVQNENAVAPIVVYPQNDSDEFYDGTTNVFRWRPPSQPTPVTGF